MNVHEGMTGVSIHLTPEDAAALTALLGKVIDNTRFEPMTELFDDLAGLGYDEAAQDPRTGYRVEVEVNDLYDPEDEEDNHFFIRLLDAPGL